MHEGQTTSNTQQSALSRLRNMLSGQLDNVPAVVLVP